jgi:hypothetical protein
MTIQNTTKKSIFLKAKTNAIEEKLFISVKRNLNRSEHKRAEK